MTSDAMAPEAMTPDAKTPSTKTPALIAGSPSDALSVRLQPPLYLVSHVDDPLGGRVAAKLLCRGLRVRATTSGTALYPWRRRQLSKLRTSGAELVRNPSSAQEDPLLGGGAAAKRAWRGVDTAVYLPASGVRCAREVVATVSDLGRVAFVRRAAEAGVRRVVLLGTPFDDVAALGGLDEVRAAAQQGGVELALLQPILAPEYAPLIALAQGQHARLTERRRFLVFLLLQPLADAAARAATAPTLRPGPLPLPAEVRRYSSVLETVETMLERSKAGGPRTDDVLWAELIMGGPLKVVTAGVARTLGLEFAPPSRYLEAFSSPSP